jgi:hypothetical protein
MAMGETRLGPESRVRQNPAVLSAAVGEAIVLLHAEKNAYYDTESVGARVWQEIAEPRTVAEVCKKLEEEYEVDAATCQADVIAFLEDAANEGIIVIDPA